MRISLYTNHIHGGWHPNDLEVFLGGNEEADVRLSEELVSLGHDVSVFTTLRGCDDALRNGVLYLQREAYTGTVEDVLICTKDAPPQTTAKRKVYWSVDVEDRPRFLNGQFAVVTLGAYHESRLPWLRDFNRIRIPYGVDVQRFEPKAERENIAIYTTSPDRGLDTLLKDWSTIQANYPGLELIVTYKQSESTHPSIVYRELLLGQDGITVSQLNEAEMIDLFCRAKFFVHPLNNPDSDLIGFSVLKARAGGCKIVVPGPIGGFMDSVETYQPYRGWVSGVRYPGDIDNPDKWLDPIPWSEIAKQWLKILEVTP